MSKRTLIYLFIIIVEILVVFLTFPFFLQLIFNFCRSCKIIDDIEPSDFFSSPLFLAVVYSIIGFYLNIRTVREIKPLSYAALMILTIVDLILLPVSMGSALVYFMKKGIYDVRLSSISNLLFLILVILIKHIIILAMNEFVFRPKRVKNKTSNGKL